jgi:hypothetical protein
MQTTRKPPEAPGPPMQTTRTPPKLLTPLEWRAVAFLMAKMAEVEDAWLAPIQRPMNTERFREKAIRVTRME